MVTLYNKVSLVSNTLDTQFGNLC